MISSKGAILCTMGKTERLPEPEAMAAFFEEIEVPVLGRIDAPGTLEGGDVVWLDERTVAVAESYRTNAEGIPEGPIRIRLLDANLGGDGRSLIPENM